MGRITPWQRAAHIYAPCVPGSGPSGNILRNTDGVCTAFEHQGYGVFVVGDTSIALQYFKSGTHKTKLEEHKTEAARAYAINLHTSDVPASLDILACISSPMLGFISLQQSSRKMAASEFTPELMVLKYIHEFINDLTADTLVSRTKIQENFFRVSGSVKSAERGPKRDSSGLVKTKSSTTVI